MILHELRTHGGVLPSQTHFSHVAVSRFLPSARGISFPVGQGILEILLDFPQTLENDRKTGEILTAVLKTNIWIAK